MGNVPASNVNNQQEPVNIMKVNEDRLDQLNRINKSLFRDGNPMPNTMKIVSVTLSEEDTVYTVLQPAKGEVWMLQQATYKRKFRFKFSRSIFVLILYGTTNRIISLH